MTQRHVVFVDATLAGLLAFQTAKSMGCRVTFVEPQDSSFLSISTKDASRIQPHLALVDQHVTIDTLGSGRLLQVLHQVAREHPIDALITTSEAAIVQVAEAAQALKLLSPGATALERAVFKDQCRQALERAQLRSPRFEVQSESELISGKPRSIHAPLVVKPTRGFGKQFSAVCKTEAEFAEFMASLRDARAHTDPMINLIVNHSYILEEYVTGSLHSCEVMVHDGRVQHFASTTRYRSLHNDLLEMGYSMPSGLAADAQQRLERYVNDVFRAVDVRFGLFHVEVIFGAEGPCLVEINGRMMGGVGPQVYQSLSGLDAFEHLLRLHLGEAPQAKPSATERAATVILVGAKQHGQVSADFSQARFEALLRAYDISFCTLKLTPGMPVRRFEGNVSVLGHVIVPGESPQASARKGHAFLKELDAVVGFEVAKYLSSRALRDLD